MRKAAGCLEEALSARLGQIGWAGAGMMAGIDEDLAERLFAALMAPCWPGLGAEAAQTWEQRRCLGRREPRRHWPNALERRLEAAASIKRPLHLL